MISLSTSPTTLTSLRSIPSAPKKRAIWLLLVSWVRPDRISSPITRTAAPLLPSKALLMGSRLVLAVDAFIFAPMTILSQSEIFDAARKAHFAVTLHEGCDFE